MKASKTISYYDQNAESYALSTKKYHMQPLYDLFLEGLPKGGKILDAGCGPGRDSKYFLRQGFGVSAFDASAQMVEMASSETGLFVEKIFFEDVQFSENTFDGIWCSASLLHVRQEHLPNVLRNLSISLKKGGHWFISMRHGAGEVEESERYFNDFSEEKLIDTINQVGHFNILHVSIPNFLKSRQGNSFVVGIFKKT